jgi:hypothetical protein
VLLPLGEQMVLLVPREASARNAATVGREGKVLPPLENRDGETNLLQPPKKWRSHEKGNTAATFQNQIE